MRAGAINAKAGNQRPTRTISAIAQPILRLIGSNESSFTTHPVITHRFKMTQRRQYLLVQTKCCLDQGCKPGSRPGMTNIRFGAADITRAFGLLGTEQGSQGLSLHRIFDRYATAMSFQVTDRFRPGRCFFKGLPDRLHIGILIRFAGLDPTTGRRTNPFDNGMNMIAILLSIIQSLEH